MRNKGRNCVILQLCNPASVVDKLIFYQFVYTYIDIQSFVSKKVIMHVHVASQ